MREPRSWLVAAAFCAGCVEPTSQAPAALNNTAFANLAGVTGTVTTLAYYGGGGVHPGPNSIDIGAPGGTPVFHQIDYIGSDIAGGWVWVAPEYQAGYCSQWMPGSPYYNGHKIYVYTYFYATDGSFMGSHRAAYQHVSPYDPNMYAWWTWNNATASIPAWPDGAHLVYGNTTSGGLYLGGVYGVSGNIYNGPGGGLCTTGSHLHQEADGWRAGQRYVGEWVTNRYHDMQYFSLAWSTPAGDPPFPPSPALPEPEPEPEPDPDPEPEPEPEPGTWKPCLDPSICTPPEGLVRLRQID